MIPAFQELVVDDNAREATGSVQLVNSSLTPTTFKIYALDIRQTNDQGEITFVDKPLQGNNFTLASFVQLAVSSVTLPAQGKSVVAYSVRNSPDLSPGGHYAAIIAQMTNGESSSEQRVLPALSSVILMRKVGGERYHLSLVEQEKENKFLRFQLPQKFTLTFSNEGNVHVTPRGLIQFSDIFGRVTHKGTINEGSLFVLPQVRRTIPVSITRLEYAIPIMLYTVSVKGHSEGGNIVYSQQYSFLYINPFTLLLILFTSSVAFWGLRRFSGFIRTRKQTNAK